MNIKETFLKLTEYTIPHGKEHTLLPYLPKNVENDVYGNYFLTIGNSTTLFTCHLDTCCFKYEKVNHIIENNIIKTDGTTILGGDNKTGVCILLYMIEHNVPGTYYFFAGEEPTAKDGGLFGSRNALKSNPNYFKQFKRAIAFDRKKEGSIITKQMGKFTCSDDFVDGLKNEFSKCGLNFNADPTGYWTDTAVFIDIIPEVTNLSSGTYNEHHPDEYVDIDYVKKVADAAIKIDWENLPTVRDPKKQDVNIKKNQTVTTQKEKNISNQDNSKNSKIKNFFLFKKNIEDRKISYKIEDILADFDFFYHSNFESGKDMIFSHFDDDTELQIKIENGIIYIHDREFDSIQKFSKYIKSILTNNK